jgi:hypothetical protein
MNHVHLYHESFLEDVHGSPMSVFLYTHHRSLSQWGEHYPSEHADRTGEGPTSFHRPKRSEPLKRPWLTAEYDFI